MASPPFHGLLIICPFFVPSWIRFRFAPLALTEIDWLKWDAWVREQHARLLQIWAEADRPWSHDHGLAPSLSIAKGKIIPEGVKKEHQRQKDLGWDVKGNLD